MEAHVDLGVLKKTLRSGNIPMTGPGLNLGPLIPEEYKEISSEVMQATSRVFGKLGPGFHEGVYQECMAHDLSQKGLTVRRQVPFSIEYEGIYLKNAYRLHLLVEERVAIMIHTHQRESDFYTEQLRTYLRHSGHRYGLLINFNTGLKERGLKPVLP